MTVVDAASIFEQLRTVDTLVDRGWQEVEGDKRTVAHLLCDQLEFADLLLLNKCDLVTEEQLGAVEAFLRKSNPAAEVFRTPISPLSLPYISPISPLYLPYISQWTGIPSDRMLRAEVWARYRGGIADRMLRAEAEKLL